MGNKFLSIGEILYEDKDSVQWNRRIFEKVWALSKLLQVRKMHVLFVSTKFTCGDDYILSIRSEMMIKHSGALKYKKITFLKA